LHAQFNKQTNKPVFRSLNQIGVVHGQAGTTPLVQTINGFQYKSLTTGIGVGLDYYKQRSVPLFLDVRKNISTRPQTPFVYLDGGYHFLWTKEPMQEWLITERKGGWYYDLGVGYSLPAFKTGAVHLSLGYSVKKMSEKVNQNPWRSSLPQPGDFQMFEYQLRRYSFKIGLAL
jgi:hypothetical protein